MKQKDGYHIRMKVLYEGVNGSSALHQSLVEVPNVEVAFINRKLAA